MRDTRFDWFIYRPDTESGISRSIAIALFAIMLALALAPLVLLGGCADEPLPLLLPTVVVEEEPWLPLNVPPAARLYRVKLVAESRRYWGSAGPVADFAGQIHQESAWRKDARSQYASGLTQFTDDTADWISHMDPELREANPLNPNWAIKAMVIYDRYLFRQWPEVQDTCERMGLALKGYNAGPGWITKEEAAGRCLRAPHNCAETENYYTKILYKWSPLYTTWGIRSCAAVI